MINPHIEKRIQEMYDAVDADIKEDTVEAAIWARRMLTNREGTGHTIHVSAAYGHEGLVVCSFAKPEWSGDHCGQPMELGSEAIVRAVCEYLCGA